jgi:CBS domain-containing protein
MRVSDIMHREVRTCGQRDSLAHAAAIMWDHDCGSVPVVDDQGTIVAMITDRDICMAAYTRGQRLDEMTVGSAASHGVVTIGEDEGLDRVEALMREAQVRRLPVVDAQGKAVGIVSIGDLARRVRHTPDGVPAQLVRALVGISERRAAPARPSARAEDAHRDEHEPESGPKGLELLRKLRDEVQVRLHLGGMELRDQWNKLESHLVDVEKKAEEWSDASRGAVADAVKRLQKFRASLMNRD